MRHRLLRADLIVLCEPDGTFSGHDLIKLLAYSDDVPVVFGTRTTREFIWQAPTWAVPALGKLGRRQDDRAALQHHLLTDMGCTYRLFSREALERSVRISPSEARTSVRSC